MMGNFPEVLNYNGYFLNSTSSSINYCSGRFSLFIFIGSNNMEEGISFTNGGLPKKPGFLSCVIYPLSDLLGKTLK